MTKAADEATNEPSNTCMVFITSVSKAHTQLLGCWFQDVVKQLTVSDFLVFTNCSVATCENVRMSDVTESKVQRLQELQIVNQGPNRNTDLFINEQIEHVNLVPRTSPAIMRIKRETIDDPLEAKGQEIKRSSPHKFTSPRY